MQIDLKPELYKILKIPTYVGYVAIHYTLYKKFKIPTYVGDCRL